MKKKVAEKAVKAVKEDSISIENVKIEVKHSNISEDYDWLTLQSNEVPKSVPNCSICSKGFQIEKGTNISCY